MLIVDELSRESRVGLRLLHTDLHPIHRVSTCHAPTMIANTITMNGSHETNRMLSQRNALMESSYTANGNSTKKLATYNEPVIAVTPPAMIFSDLCGTYRWVLDASHAPNIAPAEA